MFDILTIVIPIFLLIGAGFAAVKAQVFSASAVDGLMGFTQHFAIPCLLFAAVARLDLANVFHASLLVPFYAGATITFVLGILGARLLFGRRPGEAVSIGFSALFSNSVLLGLPISTRAFGADSLAPNYAIIAIHAPYCYLLGITVMEFARADGRGARDTVVAVANAMFRNSLMIGLALGLAVNLGGIALPEPIFAAVEMMAHAALPAALFGLGGVLTRYAIRASLGESGMICILSLIVHPALAFGIATTVFDTDQGFLNALVLTAAMAPGMNAFIFASMFDRAKGTAASTVLMSTALGVVTTTGWLWILTG